jgi:hypothetical protein
LRLFHLNVDEQAGEWLRSKGGLAYTARKGSRWIGGDDGTESNYTVARHFLALYTFQKPKVPQGNRLLMEGDMNTELIRLMSTRSGSAPDVIETLIKMIENKIVALPGLTIRENNIYVTTSAIVEYHRKDIGRRTNKNVNHRSVSQVLRGLVIPGSATNPRTLQTKTGKTHARWRVIDPYTLLEEAVEHGYPSTQIQAIIAGQEIQSEIDTLLIKEPVR